MGWVDQVEHLNDIALLDEQRRYRPERFALRVSHKEAAICLHQVWLHKEPRFTCTATADHDLQEIAPVHFAVQAHADILRQDGVVAGVFVSIFGI